MDVGRSAAAKARVEQREQAALDAARQQLPAVPVDQQLVTRVIASSSSWWRSGAGDSALFFPAAPFP
jgi:hypothetical protein